MILKRSISVFLLGLAGVSLYLLGYQAGASGRGLGGVFSPAQVATDRADTAAEDSTRAAQADITGQILLLEHADLPAQFTHLLGSGAWFALERYLVEHHNELTPAYGVALIGTVTGKINKYDAVALRRVLRAYLDAQPRDNGALFLLSDLQQMGGMREAALETLFEILAYPMDEEVARRARRQADQIITVIDIELRNRGALAEREAFWRHISQRVPGSDRYRYELALSLAQLKRWDEARRVLQETGTSDIAQTTLDELSARIDNAERGLQFERDGSRMLSTATAPGGAQLTLLVDTGANVTSLSLPALRAIAARRLQEQARIRTAAGVVTTGVYVVDELEVQGRVFRQLRVVELPAELPGLDGLLGLDVLEQLSADPLSIHQSG